MVISDTLKQAAFLPETDEVVLVLLTIDHTDLGSPIRVVNNTEDITSNGNLFVGFPFDITLPDSIEGTAPRATLVIDNVDRQIATTIRTITSAATVLIEVIRAAAPDTIERTFTAFNMTNVKWDALKVSGDLILENMQSEPFPAGQFSPAHFPGGF